MQYSYRYHPKIELIRSPVSIVEAIGFTRDAAIGESPPLIGYGLGVEHAIDDCTKEHRHHGHMFLYEKEANDHWDGWKNILDGSLRPTHPYEIGQESSQIIGLIFHTLPRLDQRDVFYKEIYYTIGKNGAGNPAYAIAFKNSNNGTCIAAATAPMALPYDYDQDWEMIAYIAAR
jgi:hypothetical protein